MARKTAASVKAEIKAEIEARYIYECAMLEQATTAAERTSARGRMGALAGILQWMDP